MFVLSSYLSLRNKYKSFFYLLIILYKELRKIMEEKYIKYRLLDIYGLFLFSKLYILKNSPVESLQG